jgi:hypothetical protein
MTTQAGTNKAYSLDGTHLQACSCTAPCPCDIGDDPDGGACQDTVAYHIDQGQINGVDVSGLSLIQVVQIPGNILAGNWRIVLFIDDKATPEQQAAILSAFNGELGGPLAELAQLAGEVIAGSPVSIEFKVEGGKGTLRAGNVVEAEAVTYTNAAGQPITIHDTVFATIPGAPASLARATRLSVNVPEHGMTWAFSGRHTKHSNFHYEA